MTSDKWQVASGEAKRVVATARFYCRGHVVKRSKSPRHQHRAPFASLRAGVATTFPKNNLSHPSHASHLSHRNVVGSILVVRSFSVRGSEVSNSRTSVTISMQRNRAKGHDDGDGGRPGLGIPTGQSAVRNGESEAGPPTQASLFDEPASVPRAKEGVKKGNFQGEQSHYVV